MTPRLEVPAVLAGDMVAEAAAKVRAWIEDNDGRES
jgi:hypothetical protein